MNLYAVLSDIHGNYKALEAVEQDARQQAKKAQVTQVQFVCLGDVVDYGPCPNECMQWVVDNVEPNLFVRGNHDQDVVTSGPPRTIHSDFWPIHLWTRHVLEPRYQEFLGKHTQWKCVSPDGLTDFTLLHGSLFGVEGRIESDGSARTNLEHLKTPYGLFGHTHFQGCFCDQGKFVRGKYQEYFMHLTPPEDHRIDTGFLSKTNWRPLALNTWHPLPTSQRMLINPGSVGQPRRHANHKDATTGEVPHDPNAAYLLLALNGDGPGKFQFRRVPYVVGETVQQLRDIQYPTPTKVKYASIDQDRGEHTPRDQSDPWEKLRYVQENIHKLLPDLIERTLIPTLLDGH